MSSMRNYIKQRIPEGIRQPASKVRYAIQRSVQYPSAIFHPWRRQSIRKINALKDIYFGQRCFIIGNGPSLRDTDIARLEGEYTFGMNRIYLGFEEWGFSTTFLVCVNSLVIEQVCEDFRALDLPKFFSWRSRKLLYPRGEPDEHTHFLFTTYTGPKFAKDASGRLWEGATVTYVCLQLAFHMGFKKVVLIGVDHSFATDGSPNTTIVSKGDDQNHFDPSYFGKGFRWQLPDLVTSEQAYQMAYQAYQADGRKVVDATIGGKLQIFPKVDYESLF